MWNNYSTEEIYFKSERELEVERLEYLRYQVEEKRVLEEDQRLKEQYDDQVLQQNVYRQREKLRLEYEADLANQQYKEEQAGRRREAHEAHLEEFTRKAEEERKSRFRSRSRQSGDLNQDVPLIVIDAIEDNRPIRPLKKSPGGSSGSGREDTAKSKKKKDHEERRGSTSPLKKKDSEERRGSTAIPKRKDSEERRGSTSILKNKDSGERRVGTSVPKKKTVTKQHSLPEEKPMKTVLQRPMGSRGGDNKYLHYNEENSDEINIEEKDGKRRRLPAKKSNDFGLNLVSQMHSRSRAIVANDDTLTNSVFDDKIRRRKKPNSNLEKIRDRRPTEDSGARMGRRSAPLPPILKRSSEGRPHSDPQVSSKEEKGKTKSKESASSYRRFSRESPRARSYDSSAHSDAHSGQPYSESEYETDVEPDPEPQRHRHHGRRESVKETSRNTQFSFSPHSSHHDHDPGQPPPPSFDWAIELKKTDKQVDKLKKINERKLQNFKDENVDVMSQLSALKKDLKNKNKAKEKEEELKVSDEDVEEGDNGSDEESEANSSDHFDENDFNRRVSLKENKLDLEGTNKTILRSFLSRRNGGKKRNSAATKKNKTESSDESGGDTDDEGSEEESESEEEEEEEKEKEEEKYHRKRSLSESSTLNLDATNKTMLRSFLNRRSRQKKKSI